MKTFTAEFSAMTLTTESTLELSHAWLVTATRNGTTETASGWSRTESNAKKAGATFARRFKSATVEVVAAVQEAQGPSKDEQIASLYMRRANTCGHGKRAAIDAQIAALQA